MMENKLIINCTTGRVDKLDLTSEELVQREADRIEAEEQALLDLLIPSSEEIEQAEFELKALNLLMEVGLI
jgi:hypothetical protein